MISGTYAAHPRPALTFQVMRRTLATDLQAFGTLKDAQTALRHKNPGTTAGLYIQPIDERVAAALDARTHAILTPQQYLAILLQVGWGAASKRVFCPSPARDSQFVCNRPDPMLHEVLWPHRHNMA